MSDWQVGDLAVCVNTRNIERPRYVSVGGWELMIGRTYRVLWVGRDEDDGELIIDVGTQTGPKLAERFRKVDQPKDEPCEEEFVTLLKRIKRPVKVP